MRMGIRELHQPTAPQEPVSQEWETAGPEQFSYVRLGNPELRRQIVDIILDVLSDEEPARPEVRARMLQHLAENPGHPERALLDHLRDPNIRAAAKDSGPFEVQDM
ncbi:hypothetical protein [Arthrobacter sp. NPDC093139]|uniref:hypothetical protein n=1 Tax=Arthrobacter sp. NPDC093139 TaxID=3363945 RepID=UPI0038120A3B